MSLKWHLSHNPTRMLILILFIWAQSVDLSWAQAGTTPKNILILHSHDSNLPAYEKIQAGMETSLRAECFQRDNQFMDSIWDRYNTVMLGTVFWF